MRLVHNKDPFADPVYKTIHSQTGVDRPDQPDPDIAEKTSSPVKAEAASVSSSEQKKPPLNHSDSTNPFGDSDENDDNVDYGENNPFSDPPKKRQ